MSADTPRLRPGSPLVIVELGADWLKMAQVSPSRDRVTISRLHLEKFDSAAGLSPQSLSNAFKDVKAGGLPVVAYLPRQMVNIRMLELPSTQPDEIADMVALQVGKQTPYSKDEIVSDYRIVGAGREGYTSVMLAIVQRSVVRQRFHILEEAGVEVDRMSVSSEGVLNWCRQAVSGTPGEAGVAVLDVDSYYSDFFVVTGGRMVFTRSILFGANQLLAEYDKWKDKFSLEVQRSMEMSRGEQPGAAVTRLFVTGAGPNVKGLAAYLGAQLNLPVEEKDSLGSVKKMPSAPSMKDPEFLPVSLTALIGMGLGPEHLEFNLIPETVRLRRGLIRKAHALTAFGILLLMALATMTVYTAVKLSFKKHRMDQLWKEHSITEPAKQEVERMRKIVGAARQRADLKWTALNLFSEVHRLIPKDVALDSVDIDLQAKDQKVLLEGLGATRQDVHALVQSLEQSPFFKGAKEEGATSQDSKTGKYKFKVVMSLRNSP